MLISSSKGKGSQNAAYISLQSCKRRLELLGKNPFLVIWSLFLPSTNDCLLLWWHVDDLSTLFCHWSLFGHWLIGRKVVERWFSQYLNFFPEGNILLKSLPLVASMHSVLITMVQFLNSWTIVNIKSTRRKFIKREQRAVTCWSSAALDPDDQTLLEALKYSKRTNKLFWCCLFQAIRLWCRI